MKFCFILTATLFFTLGVFAQVSKIYVNADGKFTTNSKHAVSYDLIEKLSDTAYHVLTYDMKDTILTEGTYKDELLSIPNGKFKYYMNRINPAGLDSALLTETGNYVYRVGYFLNGVKTGMWVDYWKKGVKKYSFVFKESKLNGRYRCYDYHYNNYVTEEGNYIDNKKDGEWNTFGFDTLNVPFTTNTYLNNKLVKKVVHFQPLFFSIMDLKDDLFQKILPYKQQLNGYVSVRFIVGAKGNIINPTIIKSYSPEIDSIILEVLKDMKKVKPQSYDGVPCIIDYVMKISIDKNTINNGWLSLSFYHERQLNFKNTLDVGP
ncbi:hypothetical protein [Mucilaginibacter sp.]|uniref:hypothetical protein n=1 Tax=Mucilaginibacter sp. TaxID=1882438 RepID=UPI003D0FBCFF